MGRIQLLPPALASQIAAGEVVERPASAVKELIENALDAEATRCDVTCDGGGVSALSVSDDGSGMSEEDAALSVERHATSKLRTIADLDAMATFGFRGEALPSIASVSRFTLRTRARDAEYGVVIEIEAGKTTRVTTAGMKIGTTLEVRDLFFNVPARRKFLRSTGTESSHVTSVVEGASLARPDVTFTLTRDGRRVRELLRVNSRRERVESLLPEESLTAIKGERGPLRLEAHLSSPERGRPGAAGLSLLVNGRIVKDRMLAATVAQAYGSSLAPGNYPRGVVYLDLPPSLVDVNVHPQKTEVRFVDARALSDAVYATLSRELSQTFSLPPSTRGSRRTETQPGTGLLPIERPALITPQKPFEPLPRPEGQRPSSPLTVAEPSSMRRRDEVPQDVATASPLVSRNDVPGDVPNDVPCDVPSFGDARGSSTSTSPDVPCDVPSFGDARGSSTSTSPDVPCDVPSLDDAQVTPTKVRGGTPAVSQLSFVAQVQKRYLLCEGADGLYVIDQHAAEERVLFTKLRAEYEGRTVASQTLLFPIMVELTPRETDWLDAQQALAIALGFDVRLRSPEQVSVHSLPRLVKCEDPTRLVREFLQTLTHSPSTELAVEGALTLLACRGARRHGQSLSHAEATNLVRHLEDPTKPLPCRHGRAVLSVTRFSELERQSTSR